MNFYIQWISQKNKGFYYTSYWYADWKLISYISYIYIFSPTKNGHISVGLFVYKSVFFCMVFRQSKIMVCLSVLIYQLPRSYGQFDLILILIKQCFYKFFFNTSSRGKNEIVSYSSRFFFLSRNLIYLIIVCWDGSKEIIFMLV